MRIVLAITALALFVPALSVAEERDLSGDYNCVGETGTGKDYRGTVRIAKSGEAYAVSWKIANEIYVGIGVLAGNTLSIAVRSPDNANYTAVVAFAIGANGVLKGRWTAAGLNRVYTETLTPLEATDPVVTRVPDTKQNSVGRPSETLPPSQTSAPKD